MSDLLGCVLNCLLPDVCYISFAAGTIIDYPLKTD